MTTADLLYISPFIILSVGAVLGMLGIAAYRSHAATFVLTLLSLVLSFLGLRFALLGKGQYVAGLVRLDGYAIYFTGLLSAAGMATAVMSYGYMKTRNVVREELYVLILIVVLGCAVLVSSVHFASFFIGLELLSVSLYTLIAYQRARQTDVEAGIKYFVPAATSSAFLLFGMALVYAQRGTMSLPEPALLTEVSSEFAPALVLLGAGMMLTAIGFKLALVPFHLWAADVYQGSPAPVTALIATVSKGAVFALLLRYFGALYFQAHASFLFPLTLVAILTMFLGNYLALLQDNIKRLLAYSSISHMGYLLVALLAGGQLAQMAVMFYLLAYFITILGAFGVIAALSDEEKDFSTIADCRGLALRRPFSAAVLALTMFSLAGIPLTAGFLGKLYVLLAGVQSHLWLLAFALVANSVVALFYYLRVVIALYEPVESTPQGPASMPLRPRINSVLTGGLLTALTVLLIGLGVYPGPLIRLIESLTGALP